MLTDYLDIICYLALMFPALGSWELIIHINWCSSAARQDNSLLLCWELPVNWSRNSHIPLPWTEGASLVMSVCRSSLQKSKQVGAYTSAGIELYSHNNIFFPEDGRRLIKVLHIILLCVSVVFLFFFLHQHANVYLVISCRLWIFFWVV